MYKILLFLFLFFFSYKSFSNEVKILNETVGNGLEVKNHSKLSVHYIGRLEDNTVFDSSYDRGQFFDFQIGVRKVILGWETGLLGMREGGKRTIFIPYQLAYGESGAGNLIPPKSNLIFDIEVIKVIPPGYKEIDGYQLKLAMTDDFKIIDIRNEDQITNKNKIPGAIQITAFDKNGNFFPNFSTINCFVNSGVFSTSNKVPFSSTSFPECSILNFKIIWIINYINSTSIVIYI